MTRGLRSATSSRQTTALLARHMGECHQAALLLIRQLSDEHFRWRPPLGPQSIGWNLWHIGRWDDFLAEVLLARTPSLSHLGPARQIWKSRDISGQWGLRDFGLGVEETGTGLTDAEAAAIKLPHKEGVVGYVVGAFGHLERVAGELDDSLLPKVVPGSPLFPGQSRPATYGDNILTWIEHAYEHLGTMEALKGMLGLRESVGD